MTYTTLLFIAVGLSMDAFAVSVSNGLSCEEGRYAGPLAAAAAFGIFQGIMPVIGYFLGSTVSHIIDRYDHWIALILLSVIGIRMIHGSLKERRTPSDEKSNASFSPLTVLIQAIATSIDALAVGISFSLLKINIWTAASFIAAVTLVLCLAGIVLGRYFGRKLGEKAQIIGGVILIIIGIKIFVEHIFFA